MKKKFALLLSVVMVFAAIPMHALAIGDDVVSRTSQAPQKILFDATPLDENGVSTVTVRELMLNVINASREPLKIAAVGRDGFVLTGKARIKMAKITKADNTGLDIPIDGLKMPAGESNSGITVTGAGVEFTNLGTSSGKKLIEMEISFERIGGYDGEIILKLSGGGIDKSDLPGSVIIDEGSNDVDADIEQQGDAKGEEDRDDEQPSTGIPDSWKAEFVIGKNQYTITENGTTTTVPMDTSAYIDENNRTMLPVRFVGNALGVEDEDIEWDDETKTATLMSNSTKLTIKAGDHIIFVDGVEKPIDTVAVIADGRTFIPVRAVAEAFGADVSWDAATGKVTITGSQPKLEPQENSKLG